MESFRWKKYTFTPVSRIVQTACLILSTFPLCCQNSSDPLRNGTGPLGVSCGAWHRRFGSKYFGPCGLRSGASVDQACFRTSHRHSWSDWDLGSLPCTLCNFPWAILQMFLKPHWFPSKALCYNDTVYTIHISVVLMLWLLNVNVCIY